MEQTEKMERKVRLLLAMKRALQAALRQLLPQPLTTLQDMAARHKQSPMTRIPLHLREDRENKST